jgi:hypothetical protein
VGTIEGTRARLPKSVVSERLQGYRSSVAANSATGRRGPISKRRNSATITIAGAFFTPAFPCYGGCAWEDFGPAGTLLPRSANPRTAATPHCFAAISGSSSAKGATPMLSRLFSLTPSEVQNKVERHRARAVAQLKSESSLKVRHQRYNAEMARARFFEAMLAGGAQ